MRATAISGQGKSPGLKIPRRAYNEKRQNRENKHHSATLTVIGLCISYFTPANEVRDELEMQLTGVAVPRFGIYPETAMILKYR